MSGPAMNASTDLGPLILGGLLAFGLSGCVNMQCVVYWQVYPQERWTTKSLVMATWFLDLCHSAFVAIAIWDSVIAIYGDWSRSDIIPWSVGPTVELTAMITFLVQSFFAYRIYKLSKHKLIIAGPVFVLAFVRLVAASVSMAEMIILKHYSAFVRPFPSWVFTLGLSLSALVDIAITTSLCFSLRSSRSPLPSTNRIIDTLVLWTIQNGSVTSLGAIASLICWTVMPQNRIFLGLHFVVAKLYANSLLAILNARSKIRNARKYDTTRQLPPIIFPEEVGEYDGSDDGPVGSAGSAILNARSKIRNSRKYNTTSQPPPIAFPEEVGEYDDSDEGPATPRGPRPWPARLNSFNIQPLSMKRGQSRIEVSIQRTVESKYDQEVEIDVMTMAAESLREQEETV